MLEYANLKLLILYSALSIRLASYSTPAKTEYAIPWAYYKSANDP